MKQTKLKVRMIGRSSASYTRFRAACWAANANPKLRYFSRLIRRNLHPGHKVKMGGIRGEWDRRARS